MSGLRQLKHKFVMVRHQLIECKCRLCTGIANKPRASVIIYLYYNHRRIFNIQIEGKSINRNVRVSYLPLMLVQQEKYDGCTHTQTHVNSDRAVKTATILSIRFWVINFEMGLKIFMGKSYILWLPFTECMWKTCIASLGLIADHFIFRSRYLCVVEPLNRPIYTLPLFFRPVAESKFIAVWVAVSIVYDIAFSIEWHLKCYEYHLRYELFMVKSIAQISYKMIESTIIMNVFFLSPFLFN